MTVIVDYLLKATTSSTGDLKALVDWADATLDRELRTYQNDRQLLMTKPAALALYRAERLETDPARKRVAKAEADRAFERFRAAHPNRNAEPPSSAAAPPTATATAASAARDATRLGKGDGAIRKAPR